MCVLKSLEAHLVRLQNWGVEPDIVVDNPPVATFGGADAQLDAALAELAEQLAAAPIVSPETPQYPDKAYHGAVTEECPA